MNLLALRVPLRLHSSLFLLYFFVLFTHLSIFECNPLLNYLVSYHSFKALTALSIITTGLGEVGWGGAEEVAGPAEDLLVSEQELEAGEGEGEGLGS